MFFFKPSLILCKMALSCIANNNDNNNIRYSYSENILHTTVLLNLSQNHWEVGAVIIPIYTWGN